MLPTAEFCFSWGVIGLNQKVAMFHSITPMNFFSEPVLQIPTEVFRFLDVYHMDKAHAGKCTKNIKSFDGAC